MDRIPSQRRVLPVPLLALWLSLVAAGAGCALLVPPSWRGKAPVPLAGPIGAEDAVSPDATALTSLSDAELLALIDADEQRLVDIVSEGAADPAAPGSAAASRNDLELGQIAARLELAQRELDARGVGRAGSRIRHPVIE